MSDNQESEKIIDDIQYEAKPKRTFELSPFHIVQLQYLRGLVFADEAKDIESGEVSYIDRNTTMEEFRKEIMDIIDSLEDGLTGVTK